MAYIKIEPTGCGIFKGWIKVKLCFYLEPTDPRYSEYYIFAIDETSQKFKDGYTGAVSADGIPINQADYDTWANSLPHIWRNDAFHNHFLLVNFDTPLTDIVKYAKDFLSEFFDGWKAGLDGNQVWHSKPRPIPVAKTLTSEQLTLSNQKLSRIKAMVI